MPALSWSGEPAGRSDSVQPADAKRSRVTFDAAPHSALRYDNEYPVIGYGAVAKDNSIARLQTRMERGEVKLEYRAPRGYLDSFLKALNIDPSSQTLVYSGTSLQDHLISAATPRAMYFNDDTYVAWIPGTEILEIAAMDSRLGAVFYALDNRPGATPPLQRETHRCLTCHDTYSMTGGGVPTFMLMTSYVDINGRQLTAEMAEPVTDKTPISSRWGGWYVTGRHGEQVHLGNMLLRTAKQLENMDRERRGNLDSLADLFDTSPFLTDKSDIVALMVLEHQAHVQNLITRVNFKARSALARNVGSAGDDFSWEQLPPRAQKAFKVMMEGLVQAMLFVDEAGITGRLSGNAGFDKWFESQGPRDARGRSLREFDLTTRMFRYPLSYLVYSEAFDEMPEYARDYVYARFAQILSGKDRSGRYSHLSAEDRNAILEILTATKPEFVQVTATRT